MKLDRTNPGSFNRSLKKAIQELTGQPVRVRIVNSYNFPHCWVQVWGGEFSNDFRLKVFDACGLDRKNLLDETNVCYGNIRSNGISAHVPEWEKVFN